MIEKIELLLLRTERIIQQNDEILLQIKSDPILSLHEIKKALNVKSYNAFHRRLRGLYEFGLYKDGGWKMKQSDLNRYIASKQLKK